MYDKLFEPLQLGALTIPNRIIMAPLTRQRSGSSRVPNQLMCEYYTQRASAGLILTEATSIEPMGIGYKDTPGIWNAEQVEGWKAITQAVHAKSGRIFSQLWHVGRISHPIFLDGQTPVAPSAIAPAGFVSLVRPQIPFVTPRALETREVKTIVQNYKIAAQNAKLAGFDGVEAHAANGYLIDQFLQSSTNKRQDEYGGSVQNRARFLLEIADALIEVWGASRVGFHLAPACDAHDMGDSNPKETFGYVAQELGKRKIAFLFAREGLSSGYLTPILKKIFGGVMIANQGLDASTAERLISSGEADAAAWGKYFISNPDLPYRIKHGLDWAAFDPSTFYSEGPHGYTDYPSLISQS
jgi:2,4-dienoyl-CoA reductase-like NADH-dependent reductase (Old Yellow Enzyme family)